MTKPKILLSVSKNARHYTEAAAAAGGMPDARYLPESEPVNHCDYDALILCGGADLHPSHYGEETDGSVKIDEARDACELSIGRAFIEASKPILGICRGHQLLNVLLGGTLIQHIPTSDAHRAAGDAAHRAQAVGESMLSRLYGSEFSINSNHHQAIARPAAHTHVTLLSKEDGVIEAFEHDTLPFLGVQFHPERMTLEQARTDTVDGLPIFRYFIDLC